MSRRLLYVLAALLVGIALGWGLRSCEEGGERSGGSWEAIAPYDSTLAAEADRWREEAEASAVRAESLAVEIRRWEAEAEGRRQAWEAARRRLDELDEVLNGLGRMEPDSLGALAGGVLRRRLGSSPAGR